MRVRTTTIQVQPGKMNEVVGIWSRFVAPVAREHSGFNSAMLLTDSDAGKCISLGVWETEADLIAFEYSDIYLEQLSKVKPFLAGPPVREGWEVSGQA